MEIERGNGDREGKGLRFRWRSALSRWALGFVEEMREGVETGRHNGLTGSRVANFDPFSYRI